MNIYVGNLPYQISEDEIREAFEAFGQVQSVSIIMDRETGRSKGFGFVEMASDQAARTAIQEMDGTELGGRPLKVNEAKPRESSRGPRRGNDSRGGERRYDDYGGDRRSNDRRSNDRRSKERRNNDDRDW